eukprot:jgi/Mesvir1/26582/Mv16232-RA.1
MEGGADGSLSSARRAQFKGGKTNPAEAGARRRRDDAVAIRKERKEVLLRAKRIRRDEDSAMPAGADGDGNTMELGGEALERECVSAVQRLEKSGATQDVVSSLRHLRRLLSQGEEPPVGAAVRAGAVPLLCAALAPSPRWSEEAALEAAWCLTNIAAGDDGECSAALAPALSLLAAHINAGGSLPLVEQCVWALGNLCGENEDMRAAVHATGTPVQMVALLRSPRASLPKTAAWALSNLLKGKSHRGAELLHAPGFGEALVELLGSSDRELVVEVAWVLTYVTAESEHNTGQLINLGLLPALCLQFCDATEHALVIPLLRTVGNVASGPDAHLAKMMEVGGANLVAALMRCLQSGHRGLQKEAAWVISNMAGGKDRSAPDAMLAQGVLPPLVQLLVDRKGLDIQKEATFAIANLCAGGPTPDVAQLTWVVQHGALPPILSLIRAPDAEAASLGLRFVELVLRLVPRGPQLVEAEDGIDAIESVQFHESEELRRMSSQLVDTYYGEDYGLEEEAS